MKLKITALILIACAGLTTAVDARRDRFYGQYVIFHVSRGNICYVIDKNHLRALGGSERRVKEVSSWENLLESGQTIHPCPLGDGFYRYRHHNQVYWIHHGKVCAVRSKADLRVLGGKNHVQVVSRDIDILGGRHNVPSCKSTTRIESRSHGSFSGSSASFYRVRGHTQVYHVSDNRVCAVSSQEQLGAMGGGRVETARSRHQIFNGKKDKGNCVWPDGFYQLKDRRAIYRISRGKICLVRNLAQLKDFGGVGQVKSIGSSAGLLPGGKDPKQCKFRIPGIRPRH